MYKNILNSYSYFYKSSLYLLFEKPLSAKDMW